MILQRLRPLVAALALLGAMAGAAIAETRLLMFEQAGCIYCRQWHAELGDIYPLTDEGRAAPLLRIDLRAPLPEGVTLRSKPVFTPTFVLVRDGVEVGRIEGYPGEDFFWGLLSTLLRAPEPAAG